MSPLAPSSQLLAHGSKRVFILVNGILTRPGAADGWTDRGVTWLHTHTPHRAEKFEYACGALTRRLRQDDRAAAIARMCGFYFLAGFEVSLVGHSNGCDLIARVIRRVDRRGFLSVHLFAAAADASDFIELLEARTADRFRIGQLFLYVSANDRALQLAGVSKTLFGWAGLGYGDLGRRVPIELGGHPRVLVHQDDSQRHSTWLARGRQFESTMQLLMEHETTPLK